MFALYICHNTGTLYLLVGKQSFSVLKIFAVEPLVLNIQQFGPFLGTAYIFLVFCTECVTFLMNSYLCHKLAYSEDASVGHEFLASRLWFYPLP